MPNPWTKNAIKDAFDSLKLYLQARGIRAKKGARLSAPRETPVEWSLVETGADGVYLASIYFLQGGKVGAKIRGLYVEDVSLTKIAAAIAGKFPGERGDWTAYEFHKLESRSTRPF